MVVFFGYVGLFVRFWRACLLAPEDITWMLHLKDAMTGHEEKLPEIAEYNPGQKGYFWGMSVMIVVLLVTGLVIWDQYFDAYTTIEQKRIAVLLHAIAAVVAICGLIVHVHMVLWEPGTLRAMTRGWVTGGWGWKHHRKWLREAITGKTGRLSERRPPNDGSGFRAWPAARAVHEVASLDRSFLERSHPHWRGGGAAFRALARSRAPVPRRAERFQSLAEGSDLAPYLRFLGALAQIQAGLQDGLPARPGHLPRRLGGRRSSACRRSIATASSPDAAFAATLARFLALMRDVAMPEASAAALARMAQADAAAREACCATCWPMPFRRMPLPSMR